MSKAKNIDWEKMQAFQNENKKFLIIVASPDDDGISISFGGLNSFVKFPMESYDKGVIFNVLRKSKFNVAIDAFITGLLDGTGAKVSDKETNELLKVVGGAIKAIGVERDKIIKGNSSKNHVKSSKK